MDNRWGVMHCDGFAHVLPMGDMVKHDLNKDCFCAPTVDEEDMQIVHSSYDQREAFAEGTRLPS